jgi:hypothetical protein
MARIAIMQSYFLPYAGYFRLMYDIDAFVMVNSTRFPRRGWGHRNRLREDLGLVTAARLDTGGNPRGNPCEFEVMTPLFCFIGRRYSRVQHQNHSMMTVAFGLDT